MDDLHVGGNASILEDNLKSLHQAIHTLDRDLLDEDLVAARPPAERASSCEGALPLTESPEGGRNSARGDLEVQRAHVDRVRHPQDSVWAVTIDNRAVGTVSVSHQGPHVARVNTFRIHPDWQHTSVLAKLIDRVHRHCWNHGYLKIVLDSQAAPAMVRKAFEHRGFHLVRQRRVLGKELLEYYVDLYFPPRHEDGIRQ